MKNLYEQPQMEVTLLKTEAITTNPEGTTTVVTSTTYDPD